jgi:hypothetical protein
MSSYDNVINWLRQNGGVFHPSLIRKRDENGVFGIYTNSAIKQGEVLCRIPPECGLYFDKYETPENWSVKLKMIYVILKEKRKIRLGEASEYRDVFSVVPNLDEFESFHPYFLDDLEKDELRKCSPVLNMLFEGTRNNLTNDISLIKNFDQTSTDDQIIEAFVISNTRCWHGMFLPVMDCFNHSSLKGALINTNERTSTLLAKVDYLPGEQVYLSYGNKDMLMLTYEYGFLDKEDYHYAFPLILNYVANTPLTFAIAKKCMDLGMKGLLDNNQSLVVGIDDFGKMEQLGKLVCLSRDGISADLFKFFKLFAISNFQEIEGNEGGTTLEALNILAKQLRFMLGDKPVVPFTRLESGSATYNMLMDCLEERLEIIDDCLTWVNEEIEKLKK